jgi:Cu+-exporting ATPase
MFRRHFIQGAAAGSAALGAARAEGAESSVTFDVKGFTCVTCAVGLQVVLGEQPGVVRVRANYKANTVAVGFDAAATSAERLREFINRTTGFQVTARQD